MPTWQYWTNKEAPPAIRFCMETVRFHHPDYRLVDDTDIEALGGAEVLNVVRNRAAYEKADVIRLWLLWKFGGQWIDSDCISLQPLPWQDLAEQYELTGFGYHKGSPYFSNAIMAGRQGSPLIEKILSRNLELVRRAGTDTVPYGALGQQALRLFIRGNPSVRRFEHWRVMPIQWSRTNLYNLARQDDGHKSATYWNPNAYTYHLTNKGLNPFRNWSREQILTSDTFFGFLGRQALGLVQPGRAKAILDRLPRGVELRGAEIGVNDGATSRVLLQQRPGLWLTIVDPFRHRGPNRLHMGRTPKQWERQYQLTRGVVSFAGSRATFLRRDSVPAAAEIADASLDFCFIDADHSYEAVRADLAAWYPKVKPGGLLCGHDYNHPRDGKQFGVRKAVDEFASLYGFPIETAEDFTWFIRV